MARRIKLAELTTADLAEVEIISAVDPNVPGYYQQVWTLTTAADIVFDGEAVQTQPAPSSLEVELDSGDPDQLPKLKGMVESAKASFLEGLWHVID